MGRELRLIAQVSLSQVPCNQRFKIHRSLPIVAFSLSCRVAPPDWAAGEYSGPTGDDRPLAHQQVEVGGDAETGTDPGDDTHSPSLKGPTVIVLVTDGARIDETLGDGVSSVTGEPTALFLPTIRAQLFPQGAMVARAHNSGVTITAEGHGELVTGRRIPLANFPTNDGAGDFRPTVPTLFEVLRQAEEEPLESTVIGGNSGHLRGLTQSHHPLGGADLAAEYLFVTSPDDPTQAAGDDAVVIESVQAWMDEHPTRLLVANLHQMDRTGHYNDNPQAYATRVKAVDEPIVAFWEWVQAHPSYKDQTTLIVVADHGRHRLGTPADHRHHGDSCSGCRQIPLFLVGPRIKQGVRTESTAILADVGATIAELLNVELPLATGRVLSEVLVDPPLFNQPQGYGDSTYSGENQVWRAWQDNTEHRSAIFLNGEKVSTESALHAEAPVLVDRSGLSVACWREITIGEEEIDVWPWEPLCRRTTSDGTWVEFRFPVSPVSPYFRPALAIDQAGQLWSSMVDNPTGNWEAPGQLLRIHRWTASRSWEEASSGMDGIRYAMHPALVPVSGGVVVAVVSSDTTREGDETPVESDQVHERARYRRHIQIHHIGWPSIGSPVWTTPWRSYTADHFAVDAPLPAPPDAWEGWEEIGRVDRPALGESGHTVHMAFLAMGIDGGSTTLRYQASADEGLTWTNPTIVDEEDVAPHITPVISEGAVYWARRRTDGVHICRWAPAGTTTCVPTTADAIDGLRVSGTTWTAGLRMDGAWLVQSEPW